jgi:hypothetical protein
MDLKLYFQKVREVERSIDGDYAVVVSLESPDGGRPGQMTEVSKSVAGRLVADGKARLAHADESRDFYLAIQRERDEILARESEARQSWPFMPATVPPPPKPKRRQPNKDDE